MSKNAIQYLPQIMNNKNVAFLRGINVGGHKKVPMAELKKVLEGQHFKNVKTLLASGNVVFESPEKDMERLATELSVILEDHFKFNIPVILRSFEDIKELLANDPFKGITVTKDIRLYVTFLPENAVKSSLPIPYISPDGSFKILTIKGNNVISFLDLSKVGTVGAMAILEKEFGKNITTRNWNTVVKIGNL